MSLPGKYGGEAGIASGYNQSVGSLIPGPTPLYIPGFQPGTRPILVGKICTLGASTVLLLRGEGMVLTSD
jgi:hypothetical protein